MVKNQKAFDDMATTLQEITEHVKPQLKDNQEFKRAYFSHTDMLSGTPAFEFRCEYVQTAKSGRETEKTDKILIKMKYNPLTGEPFFLEE